MVSLLLPTAAAAVIFEGLSRSYGVTHSQSHGLTVATAFGISGGFLVAVSGMSIWSAKRARMKIAGSLFGLFLVGLLATGLLVFIGSTNPWGWLDTSFLRFSVVVCWGIAAGLLTASIVFLSRSAAQAERSD